MCEFGSGLRANFQFTTSHGGRHIAEREILSFSAFQFTTSHGGRLE